VIKDWNLVSVARTWFLKRTLTVDLAKLLDVDRTRLKKNQAFDSIIGAKKYEGFKGFRVDEDRGPGLGR
jgi:hypothetical protein